jgi:uncharacterized protein RhaS with RHS repeats
MMEKTPMTATAHGLRNLASLLLALLFFLCASPASARYLSPDTFDPWLAGVDINRYAYSGNDPVNQSDPNGHATCGMACGTPTMDELEAIERAISVAESNQDLADFIDDVAGPIGAFGDATMAMDGMGTIPKGIAGGLTKVATVLAASAKLTKQAAIA